jgi:hypothetical protein
VCKFGEEPQLQLLQLENFGFGLDFLLSYGLDSLPNMLCLERGMLLVLGFSSGIILSVKFKVLGGGLCAYGWVTILLYCLW